MLTKFAAALLATSLVAGSAIAAQPSPTANGAPAVQTQVPAAPTAKVAKHAARHRNHVRKHIARSIRKHVARSNRHVVHQARHAKPAKGTTHQATTSKVAKHS